MVIECASLCIESVCDSQAFNQGGFSRTILADKECYRVFKCEFFQRTESLDAVQIGICRNRIKAEFTFTDKERCLVHFSVLFSP